MGFTLNHIKLFEINEIDYTNRSSKEDYQWAYRAAICSRQIDNWLRTIPLDFKLPSYSDFLWKWHQKRDRTMADNIEWIKIREGGGNMLLFASMAHLSKSPISETVKDSIKLKRGNHVSVGQYLASRYQEDYKVIGNFCLEMQSKQDSIQSEKDAFQNMLVHEDIEKYYRLISDNDKVVYNKEWKIGLPFRDFRTYMNPYQGVDILFFSRVHTKVEN